MAHFSIDPDFVRFGQRAFAIRQINSIDVRRHYPHGRGLFYILTVVVVLCALGGLGSGNRVAIGLAIALGLLAVLGWRRSRTVEYRLFLTTSSSEVQAVCSRDPSQIDEFRRQIEASIRNFHASGISER